MNRSDKRDQQVAIWLLPLFLVGMVGGLALAGFLPPHAPSQGPEAVAAYYRDNAGEIRASLLLINVCCAMVVPFFVAIAMQMKRMQLSSQSLTYGFLMCVAANAGLFMVADLAWLSAAFRVERDPAVIQMLNDIGWVCFSAPVGAIVAQTLMLGAAILLDRRPDPVFPRWAAYFNFAAAALVAPSALVVTTTHGALAWNGAVSFWLRCGAFVLYLVVMFVLMQSNIRRWSNTPGASSSPAWTSEGAAA